VAGSRERHIESLASVEGEEILGRFKNNGLLKNKWSYIQTSKSILNYKPVNSIREFFIIKSLVLVKEHLYFGVQNYFRRRYIEICKFALEIVYWPNCIA
jgi:hypothetical protein